MSETLVQNKLDITPDTRVGKLLQAYPQLEQELINLSPEFARLKNPVLRKTVAKVATLRQVAQLGGIPLADLVNRLRDAAGIEGNIDIQDSKNEESQPDWLSQSKVVQLLDAGPIIASGGHPMEQVMRELNQLKSGQVFELIAPFVPAPLIDLAKNKGYAAWIKRINENETRTYFAKK